jgi:prophage regulatory protein
MSDALSGDGERLIRLSEVKQRVGLGKTLIYEMISEGRFPKPYKITPAAARWSARELDAWIAAAKEREETRG